MGKTLFTICKCHRCHVFCLMFPFLSWFVLTRTKTRFIPMFSNRCFVSRCVPFDFVRNYRFNEWFQFSDWLTKKTRACPPLPPPPPSAPSPPAPSPPLLSMKLVHLALFLSHSLFCHSFIPGSFIHFGYEVSSQFWNPNFRPGWEFGLTNILANNSVMNIIMNLWFSTTICFPSNV